MNVKISSGKLRFKITAEELDLLKEGQTLKEILQIGRRKLSIVIGPVAASDELTVIYDEDSIRLILSPGKVEELLTLGRSREGLEQVTDNLTISLQVDFRTQKKNLKRFSAA